MPGYTKDQLAAMNADRSQFKWCRKGCKRYWSKRGFASHARACGQQVIVKFTMPKLPKPKKGDVVIIHPAWQHLMDWLIDRAIETWMKEERDRVASGAPAPAATVSAHLS